MEYLNEYFGYDRNVVIVKQEGPLNLAAKTPTIQRYHPYGSEKNNFNYKFSQNQDYYHQEPNLAVSRRSVGSPSCTSDSESSISSSSHERLSASPIDILTITNNNNTAPKSTKDMLIPNMISGTLEVEYQKFREDHLARLTPKSHSNQNMRRSSQFMHQNDDPMYREKREKNNLAAKKSRDARKQREDEMVVRCAFLESELMKSSLLRKQDRTSIEEESAKLKEMDLVMSQQSESISEFQKLIFQLKSNNNNNGNHQMSSFSI